MFKLNTDVALLLRQYGLFILLSVAPCATAVGATVERTAIVGVKIYPSPHEEAIDDGVILIEGERIKQLGPRSSTPVPPGYRVMDQTGRIVTAGFWNSHVHLTTPVFLQASKSSDGELTSEMERAFTRWGFTTIFDLASTTAISGEVRRRINSGNVIGPRILSVGEPFYPAGATPVYARPFYEAFQLPSAEISSELQAVRRVDEAYSKRLRRCVIRDIEAVWLGNQIIEVSPVDRDTKRAVGIEGALASFELDMEPDIGRLAVNNHLDLTVGAIVPPVRTLQDEVAAP